MEVRPFSQAQIKLLETFADQAVIAIENVRLFNELKESLEQQTATSEILGVIASSPTDMQPVLNAVAENAARLCDASEALIFRVNGDTSPKSGSYGSMPVLDSTSSAMSRGGPVGRAILDRQTIHVHDLAASESDFPDAQPAESPWSSDSIDRALASREASVGAIYIRRKEVRPFTDRQIKLLETFADQAVIAIENVRLFKELQERNAEFREALEHQTATGEVLRVIASSPTELQPVLDTLIANAVKLSGATKGHVRQYDGKFLQVVAHFGETPEEIARYRSRPIPAVPERSVGARALIEKRAIHVLDVQAEDYVSDTARQSGERTRLAVPLLREGAAIGTITIWRDFVEPFTERQIELVKTFADQAVIAIENVRLFKELQESNRDLTETLEQQTATSEILGVIASSPTDIQPVLDVVVANAARLCDAVDVQIWRVDGNRVKFAAHHGSIAIPRVEEGRPITRGIAGGRAIIDREIVHIPDVSAPEVQAEFPDALPMAQESGTRTLLAAPLLREGTALGYILIRRYRSPDRSQPIRSRCSKPLPIRRSSPSRTCDCSKNCKSATQNCGRPWSIRRRLPKCSASSAARRRMCSRSSMPSSRAPPGFVESMTWCCDSAGDTMLPGLILVPYPSGASRSVLMRRSFSGCASMARFIFPMSAQQNEFPMVGSGSDSRTFLVVPLRQQGEFIGVLTARRTEVRPFTPAQIKLLETFADQAVIAIENVRLFQELKESLEQQTATSEILGVIASSPTDIQPVLDAVAENAARLCEATDTVI